MTQTSPGEPLTVQGALRTLAKYEGLEADLYHRTEGITSMLWAFVVAGIFFTYHALAIQYPSSGAVWGPLAWLPWVGAGMVATGTLWRSVHVTAATHVPAKEGLKEGALYLGLFVLLFFGGFAIWGIFLRDGLPIGVAGFTLAILGVASTLLGVIPRAKTSPTTRRAQLVSGIVMLAAVVILAFVPHGTGDAGQWAETLVGAAVAGGTWFLAGVYLTTKG